MVYMTWDVVVAALAGSMLVGAALAALAAVVRPE